MTWARLILDAAAMLWWFRLLAELVRRPAGRWQKRWLGKGLALVIATLLFSVWFGFLIPYGAMWVWWKVVIRGRDPFELPMADGRRMR